MRTRFSNPLALSLAVALAALVLAVPQSKAQPRAAQFIQPHSTIPQSALLQPAQLAQMIRSGHAPTIIQVGFTTLYQEAHITGSIHAGPAVSDAGRAQLRKAVEHMDRHKLLVIYCGCCPWPRCPNIRPAFAMLRQMGFTNVKAVYIQDNFGANWVSLGYPTVKGA